VGLGRIGKVLSTERITRGDAAVPLVSIKLDFGGVIMTADQFQPAGQDSPPLPGDFVAVPDSPRVGGGVAVACADPATKPGDAVVPKPGEWVAYSRDSSPVYRAEIALLADGTVLIRNRNNGCTIVMHEAGDMSLLSPGCTVKLDNGQIDITCNGDANITATNANINAKCNLGVGGKPIARFGDAVQCVISGGSSSGTWPGTITAGSANHTAS